MHSSRFTRWTRALTARSSPPSLSKPLAREAIMASEELFYATIRDIGARFRRRALSPVELTRAHLERIEKLDPTLHAFVTVTADRALADAKAAETALGRGDISSPLLGIPIGYKDIYATRGILTTGGSALLKDWIPDEESTCGVRLQRAGTVMLGKLIMHEFAFGIQFLGHRFPAAKNPWDLERMPGGSSSGSGAALAAGMVFGALGSDTGGSIRGPASLCGIAGLKPTYGRCSRAGVLTLSWTLDHTGPMARTVEDCAILLQAIAGYDPKDPASADCPIPDYRAALTGDIRGLRIGIVRHLYEDDNTVTPEVRAALEEAYAVFRSLGATLEDVRIRPAADYYAVKITIAESEQYAIHEEELRTRPGDFGADFLGRALPAVLYSGADYIQAQRERRLMLG